jgi:hypothetical protein
VASFLKQWLRQLESPIIPPDVVNRVYRAHDQEAVKQLLREVPELNRKALALIVGVLACVIENREVNRMNEAALTTCISSSFTQSQKGLTVEFVFIDFVEKATTFLNETKDEFVLE